MTMVSGSGIFFEPRSGSYASFVELVGNAILISGLDLGNTVDLLQPGRYPLQCMPSLIHETDHFDAFRMPVGNALAIVYLRAWSRAAKALAAPSDPDAADDTYESAVDIIRYRTITAALAPLLEGLALYSEFDATPGDSPVTRTSTMLAAILFGGDIEKQRDDVTVSELARQHLWAARRLEFFISRKENLISQPFSIRHGGYLPGYYLVKNIFHYLLKYGQNFNLLDGDLFLWTMHVAIMGDLELARLILDPELDLMHGADPATFPKDAVNAPFMRLQSRLRFILEGLTAERVSTLERIISEGNWTWDKIQLDCTPEQSARALSVLVSETDKLTEVSRSAAETNRKVSGVCERMLSTRHLLCLASFEADIEITKGGRCNIGSLSVAGTSFPQISVPGLPGVPPGSGPGTYEFYYAREQARLFQLASRNQSIVAVVGLEGDDAAAACRLNLSVRGYARLKAGMESDIDQCVMQHPVWGKIVGHYDAQIEGLMEEMYGKYVGAFLEGEYKGQLTSSIIERGLLAVPRDQLSVLSMFAQVACRCGNFASAESLEENCAASNLTVKEFNEHLLEWNRSTTFPLVRHTGELTAFLL